MTLIETTIDPRVQTGRLIRDAFTGCANPQSKPGG